MKHVVKMKALVDDAHKAILDLAGALEFHSLDVARACASQALAALNYIHDALQDQDDQDEE
jgi:hypothetical protein